MKRRDFFKLGAAAGAGAILTTRNVTGSPSGGIPQGAMVLPENPDFRTRHLVAIILGNGARKIDVVGNDTLAPFHSKMVGEGTLFSEDYGETANLHGYMVTELLTGCDTPAQRPVLPTWNEYVRKKTGGAPLDFWMLQSASLYRGWAWDVKHFSAHPDYGAAFGATNLTANKVLTPGKASPRDIVARHLEPELGHSARERSRLEEWLADVRSKRVGEIPSTKESVIDRPLQVGDCQSILMAGEILRAFKPKMITIQLLALDEAHAEHHFSDCDTGFEAYRRHLRTTDELIGRLWADIQADPYFRGTTALLIRPECGRDRTVNPYGQLGHTTGSYDAHYVWTTALGPDFKRGHVVKERVQRRDLAPTITYLMSGENAEYATGHVRTQLFDDRYRMPPYVPPPTVEVSALERRTT
jgi:hypothetical protein